jgi:hypothetical protein
MAQLWDGVVMARTKSPSIGPGEDFAEIRAAATADFEVLPRVRLFTGLHVAQKRRLERSDGPRPRMRWAMPPSRAPARSPRIPFEQERDDD